MIKNYYLILEIRYPSNEAEIKLAFRNMAKKYHPDINKESGAEDKFKLINEAYRVLSNPLDKRNYDYDYIRNFASYTSGFGNFSSHDIDELLNRLKREAQKQAEARRQEKRDWFYSNFRP